MAIPSFGSDNNPNYQAIVRIIRNALRDGFSISQVVRAVADAIREYRRKQFMQYHKVKENNGRYYDVPATLSVKDPESEDFLLKSPGGELSESIEHCDLWLRRGKPYLMTTNPYFVSKDELKKLIEHCDKYDIDFQIDAESDYFPGQAIRILFKHGTITPGDATNHIDEKV